MNAFGGSSGKQKDRNGRVRSHSDARASVRRAARRATSASPAVSRLPLVHLLLLLFCLLLLDGIRPSSCNFPNEKKYSTRVVHTRYGLLRGVQLSVRTSSSSHQGYQKQNHQNQQQQQHQSGSHAVEAYLGVPYATPPLGSLRFMPPVTPSPWRGEKIADTPGPPCPQQMPPFEAADSSHTGPSLPKKLRARLGSLAPILANHSEDCLYLNLYVPASAIIGTQSERGGGGGSLDTGGGGSSMDLLPALLLIHGDSYSWGSGNPLDGSALAAHGRLIVVSINFRLGILGFLKTSAKASAQGNYGLMDLVAGVHWLRENLPAFGGDSNRLTLLGHGTGAALANFLAVSPMTKELVERVVLLGGSALSPWALQREPLTVKRRVAELLKCPGDPEADDIAPCLRDRSVEELLKVRLDVPRFTSGYAPFVDGAILPSPVPSNIQPTVSSSGLMPQVPSPGIELATFGDLDVLMGLTSDEAWLELTEQDLEDGVNETRRDRILRTYVRNTYRYHLHEIFSTLRNEYTDWERSEPEPKAICEGLLQLLGDGQVAAPMLRTALVHAAKNGRGYLLHFQPGTRPSQKGDEMPYLLGEPLLTQIRIFPGSGSGTDGAIGYNFTVQDEALSRLLVHYLANFVRSGDPNGRSTSSLTSTAHHPQQSTSSTSQQQHHQNSEELLASGQSAPFWDSYDSINQYYLEANLTESKMRSHYRGHKMSLWLNLLPQLHRPGYELSMRHHHLAESPALYEGRVRPQTMAMPIPAPPLPLPQPTQPSISSSSGGIGRGGDGNTGVSASSSTAAPVAADCTTSLTGGGGLALPPVASVSPNNTQQSNFGIGPNNLLRKLASSHYQSYTTALTVTIGVGVFLLLLNILIFVGIYHQRDKGGSSTMEVDPCSLDGGGTTGTSGSSKKDDLLEMGCSVSGSTSASHLLIRQQQRGYHLQQRPESPQSDSAASSGASSGLSCSVGLVSTASVLSSASARTKLHHQHHLQQQQHRHSVHHEYEAYGDPMPSIGGGYYCSSPRARTPSPCIDATMAAALQHIEDEDDLPEPPPPPKSPAPHQSSQLCPGILRQPGTPASAKKRVQIQEISV
ncbi:hypothetical protein QAD02_022317 [Eretmocerus hayati]|uniref:Uncharacterized protein n=1 Tax=Eretmocerus hayati TaxID=131215 RepID=A0ACC2PTT2_9HYME|nr:hypothetical protein QAD02_022317 [Eretmocerus hayati]